MRFISHNFSLARTVPAAIIEPMPAPHPALIAYVALVFSGAAIALLLAAGQLLIRNRNPGNRLLFYLYGSIGIIELQSAVFAGSPYIREAAPHLMRYSYLLLLLPGPLTFVFIRDILLMRTLRYPLIHFVIPAVFTALMLPFGVLDVFSMMGLLQCAGACIAISNAYITATYYLDPVANLILLAYLGLITVLLLRSHADFVSGRNTVYAVSTVLLLSIGAVLANLAGFLTRAFIEPESLLFSGIGSIMLTLIVYLVLLFAHVFPELLYVMRPMQAYDRDRVASPVRDLDIERLYGELTLLMEEERLYQDEDLQLGRVADALEVRPNQLTYFLNHVVGKNFAAYVNSFRVREARRLLVDEPDRPVLSIGFAVGFNSKAAFYRAFQHLTGLTPATYRRRNRHRGQRSQKSHPEN